MVKTRSSISPSASSKAMNPKNKSKETMSEGSDSGESELSSKRKRNNVGSKKGKHADRPLKKMKQVIEEDDVEYDSDDLEIGVPDSIKEWEQYFKPESRVKGKMIFFPNTLENKVIANINAKFSLAEFAVITGLLCNGDNDMKKYAKRENAFVDKYFFEQQVTHGAVEQRFMFSEFKSDEYAVKMAILYLLTNGLICSPDVKKVSDELMNIVGLGEYDSFPWGKINDDDLVLTNEEEPVVEVEKAGDEMLVDNKVEEVLDVTNIENKGIGGDGVGAKEVKGGGNVGGSSGGVSGGELAVKEGKELLVVLLGKAEEDDEDVHVVEYSAEAPLMTLAVWVYFGFTVDGDEVARY
ncbi:hypothetical protein F8388_003819 [Cannabis sativa]|uniref:DUF1985 domain-containing protein n=1 Tax=Cannabis sativa TaxID=3483 RepID=A0A7J6GNM6_CANSA|nr:hypothetical protein F8388_003819 [Cannabis sativa]